MAIVSLTEVKTHLRITQTTEDALLGVYIGAAEKYIEKYLNNPNIPENDDIKAAALMLVGGFYQHRESTVDDKTNENPAVKALLFPYRECMGI